MKTKLLFLAMAFVLPFFTNAAVITVSNNPNSPGQYTDLQTAIDAAAANDILYVHASATNYGYVTINKKLTIIGGGVLPDKSLQLLTSINTITLGYNSTGTSNASGSSISGCDVFAIYIYGYNSDGINYGFTNISIKRNRIHSLGSSAQLTSTNYTIQNNIITSDLGGFKLSNSVISNNIIGQIANLDSTVGGNTFLVSNNIILNSIYDVQSCLIANNIFLTTSFSIIKFNTITKNMFYVAGSTDSFDQAVFETTQNTFSGNLYNQNPNFLSNEGVSVFDYNYSNPAIGPFVNYNLTSTSPGKNYGTDGTDVGIHGGVAPYVQGNTTDSRFRYFPQPAIPQMMEMNILNNSITQNGTLNVNFTAKKND